MRRGAVWLALLAAAFVLSPWRGTAQASAAGLPSPDHIVVVVMENHGFSEVLEGGDAPFIQSLARRGALFTRSFAVAHPSQPNYFALFSGSTQGVADDGYHLIDAPTLAGELHAAHKTFIGYVERGSPRKHNPWESFMDSQGVERPLGDFPRDFRALPSVSFVIPDETDDMHSGSVRAGDGWLRSHIGGYARWCGTHDSLLVLTFDETESGGDNRIATIVLGAGVMPGRYDEKIDHYAVLRTLSALERLPPLGLGAREAPIARIWRWEPDSTNP